MRISKGSSHSSRKPGRVHVLRYTFKLRLSEGQLMQVVEVLQEEAF